MIQTITFLFPHPVAGPTGGYKVIYEYANRLVGDGYLVNIVYSGSIFWKQKSLFHKLSNGVRYVQQCLKGYSCRGWFPLDKRVKEVFSLSLNYRHVPNSDLYVATSPYTAYYLNQYPVDAAGKFYLIQDREDWGPGLRQILFDTYHYPLHKMVVAGWLQRMLREEHGEEAALIPNGFDFSRFSLTVPVESKNPLKVSMLYHEMERKDCAMGFRALSLVKERYPQLQVNLFGVPDRPEHLPSWYTYYKQPDDVVHNRINNESAIYIGTSRTEGWGLTVGEAMICGQAVCCTDNEGYKEMAVDGQTALLSPVGDSEAMARNIIRLIDDEALRFRLAHEGSRFIRQFSWNQSYDKLLHVLGLR